VDDSETVWVEREYVGHGFRDDDLSRLRTERVVFDECDFRGVNLTESEHAGSAFRNCTFDRDGRYNIPKGDPDYQPKLDRDNNGLAREG
jgi:uncharacterized protein YjbI with pentapeptide repeats